MFNKHKSFVYIFAPLFLFGMLCTAPPALARISDRAEVKTSGEVLALRVAPGELLPISVKFLNFGAGEKVDVAVMYRILDEKKNVLVTENETVAVETTASFIKNIQIPKSFAPGTYIAESSIVYKDQDVPATSNFQFTVEKKIFGVFQSDFYLYLLITLAVGALFAFLSRLFMKKRETRVVFHDYSSVPKGKRMYYEMVSDMIAQMHRSEGDRAYEMAGRIDGLTVDSDSGKVLEIKNDPAEIVTLLLIKYQTTFGNGAAIFPKSRAADTTEDITHLEKNVDIINTYFSKK
jgi:hypothetical protein